MGLLAFSFLIMIICGQFINNNYMSVLKMAD